LLQVLLGNTTEKVPVIFCCCYLHRTCSLSTWPTCRWSVCTDNR